MASVAETMKHGLHPPQSGRGQREEKPRGRALRHADSTSLGLPAILLGLVERGTDVSLRTSQTGSPQRPPRVGWEVCVSVLVSRGEVGGV